MNHIILSLLTFCIFSLQTFSQSLSEFIQERENKMQYDESKLVFAPGTKVKIIPPEYFTPDPEIKGFTHKGSACTIQIIEIPKVPYKSIVEGMTQDYIQKQGYKFIDKVDLKTHIGDEAICFIVSFKSQDTEFERLMFFTGKDNTIWVNINYPTEMKKLLLPALIASLLSVQ